MASSEKDLHSLENIVRYCDEMAESMKRFGDFGNYISDIDYQKSCALSLLQIGENVKKLSEDFKNEFSDMPWKQSAGLRDVIAHDYFGIDHRWMWETLTESVPKLRRYCAGAIQILQN